MPGQGKKPLTEAQRAALARGQAARKRNIAARRASRARQGASSQVSSLPSLARDALQANPASPASEPTASSPNNPAASGGAGSTNSSTGSSRSKLTQDEQDALLFSFAMGDEDEQAAAASSEGGAKRGGLGDKLAGLLTSEAPKATGNQQEDDAQQAAAQWQDLAAIAFIFICGQVFGADLAPSEKQAQAMAAPLCRILMRHVAPLRTASADAYDIAAFAGAVLIYYQSISPELARRRAERKVIHAPAQTQSAQASGADSQPQRGNVHILRADAPAGSGRHVTEPAEAGRPDVREVAEQPYRSDVGASLISETLGVQL